MKLCKIRITRRHHSKWRQFPHHWNGVSRNPEITSLFQRSAPPARGTIYRGCVSLEQQTRVGRIHRRTSPWATLIVHLVVKFLYIIKSMKLLQASNWVHPAYQTNLINNQSSASINQSQSSLIISLIVTYEIWHLANKEGCSGKSEVEVRLPDSK